MHDFQDCVIQGEVLSGKIRVIMFQRENVLFSSILVLTFTLTSGTFLVSKKISPLMIVLRLDGPVAQHRSLYRLSFNLRILQIYCKTYAKKTVYFLMRKQARYYVKISVFKATAVNID